MPTNQKNMMALDEGLINLNYAEINSNELLSKWSILKQQA